MNVTKDMNDEYEVVFSGREELIVPLERDYADMKGDGWDLIWVPTSPLTTDWRDLAPYAQPDPDQHVKTAMARRGPRRRAARVLRDWSSEHVTISQQSRGHR